jgi:peroxiredoxin Q/BCP
MAQLAPGDPAPRINLPDAHGELVDPFAQPGKVIVYFYPAAMTPGCTIQAVDFSASAAAFAAAGYRIVGISPDTPEKLARFEAKSNLAITLLADPQREVIAAWGAWGERVIWGKAVEGVLRSTFVVAVAGGAATVERAYYAVKATGHVERLRRELGV